MSVVESRATGNGQAIRKTRIKGRSRNENGVGLRRVKCSEIFITCGMGLLLLGNEGLPVACRPAHPRATRTHSSLCAHASALAFLLLPACRPSASHGASFNAIKYYHCASCAESYPGPECNRAVSLSLCDYFVVVVLSSCEDCIVSFRSLYDALFFAGQHFIPEQRHCQVPQRGGRAQDVCHVVKFQFDLTDDA